MPHLSKNRHLWSILSSRSCCNQPIRHNLRFFADSADQAHDEHKTSETADFAKHAVKAPIEEAKKQAAKLMGDAKPMSKQSMEPAGHMQGRRPGSKANQYASLSKKKDEKWGGQSPTDHYKEDPDEPAVGSDPRSASDAEAASKQS